MKYSHSTDGEYFQGSFESRAEAAAEAFGELSFEGCKDGRVWTAQNVEPFRLVAADLLIENIQASTTEEAGDWAEDYLTSVSKGALFDLQTNLQNLWDQWEEKHGLKPDWWNAEDVIEHKRNEG
jgi:hypothetical protein